MARIGTCDLCDQERNVTECHDSFGVHVMDICEYGCNDERRTPSNTVKKEG
jgi:hypothetical protein